MRLADEFFQAILGSDGLRVEGRQAERRAQDRVRLPARVHVIPMSQNVAGKPISAQVRDLSQEGIGLLLNKPLSKSDNLLIRLQSKQQTTWVLCTVARSERVAENLYVVGATFSKIVNPGKG